MIMTLMLGMNACKKDKEEEAIKQYLEIEGGILKSGGFPSASSSANVAITDIVGNSSVIQGGSNPISVYTSDNVQKILVGVDGISGYYEYSPSLKSAPDYYLISLVLSTNIPNETFTIIIAVIGNDGLVSQVYELPVGVIDVGTGVLQVSLSWDQENDLDLHLIEPGGEEIYFSNSVSENGGFLDLDSNPACYIDGIQNENITYSDEAVVEAGTYIVKVDPWSYCSLTENTHFIVTARLNGQLITGSGLTNPYHGIITPNTVVNDDSGIQVMSFTISSSQLKSTSGSTYHTLRFENERNFKTSTEKLNSK